MTTAPVRQRFLAMDYTNPERKRGDFNEDLAYASGWYAENSRIRLKRLPESVVAPRGRRPESEYAR